jgi:glycosyltransferase involved in cell wall biosynthesis
MYGADPKKMRVLFPAIDQEFYGPVQLESLKELDIPDRFFLFVGMGNERKNVEVVVAALEAMSPEARLPVVVVGGSGSYRYRMEKMIQEKGLATYFIFIGACSNQALHSLYSKAIALIYASLYEGFGMPVAEAMICDCPVIASDASSIPEAGGNAAVYFSAEDAAALHNHMYEMSIDNTLRETCINRGKEHREKFNPTDLTNSLMQYYREVMEG